MSKQNKVLVRRFIDEVYNQGRPEIIDELFADDYVDHTASTEQAPGPSGARQIYDVFHAAFPDLRVEIHDLVADDDLVTFRSTMSGTSKGPLMGAAPTGNRIEIASMVFLRIRDGRIVERWEQMDLLGLMLQLGIVSESGSAGGDA
jgi:steroid delta-isomerase-like uncharacterized protein